MAVTARDRHGTVTKERRAQGPPLDRASARYYAVVRNVWSRGYTKRADAEMEERRMKGQVDAGVELDRQRITLADFVANVWQPDARQRVSLGSLDENTLGAYELQLDRHILPKLGGLRLKDVTAHHLQTFYVERKKTRGWRSAKSMINLHSLVSNILALAVDRDYIVKNPAKVKGVRPKDRNMPAVRSAEALTPDEARNLLAYTEDDRLAAAWRLILVGGLRRGEALGLTWSDIDLDAGRVRLERTWKTLAKTRENVVGPIKTGRPRTITVDARTVAMLRTHRAQQAEERLKAGAVWVDLDVVFTNEIGEHLVPETFSRRFKRLLGGAVRNGHLHELRHTAVTMAVNAGMPIHVAAERFGHSPAVMLGIYSHVARDQEDAAAETLATVIDG
jgi:integrase